MKTQQGRGPEDNSYTRDPAWPEQERPEAEKQTVQSGQIGRTLPRSIEHEKLLLHQGVLSDNGPGTAGPQKLGHGRQHMREQHEEVLHRGTA